MSDSKPIVCRIVDAFEARLKTITVANGYSLDLEVERIKQDGQRIRDGVAFVGVGDAERIEDASVQGNEDGERIRWRQPIIVIVYIRESVKDPVPIDERLNVVRSDIERCIATADHTWGGLAERTLIQSPQIWYDVTPPAYRLEFEVEYSTQYADPYR